MTGRKIFQFAKDAIARFLIELQRLEAEGIQIDIAASIHFGCFLKLGHELGPIPFASMPLRDPDRSKPKPSVVSVASFDPTHNDTLVIS